MSKGKFELFKSKNNDQYYFHLNASNGETILSSEGYTSEQARTEGITSVRINAPKDARYDRRQNGSSYTFNLEAANGKVIGRSESYTSAQNRDNGIEAVKKYAPDAELVELP